LIGVSESIGNALDEGRKCLTIFLDLAKAFDTVSHEILMRKLELIGVRGVVLNFFKSYLKNRTQRTKIARGVTSDEMKIEFGVPQGSTLGPVLFLIYINGLCDINVGGRVVTFADDTILFVEGNSWEEVFKGAELDINKMKIWLENNLLTLNVSKTKYMTYSLNSCGQPDENLSIKIHECRNTERACACGSLDRCKTFKYLGLELDCHWRWDAYMRALAKRMRKLIYVFCTLRRVMTATEMKPVYFALCQSILSYGIVCWGAVRDEYARQVMVAHKAILRVIHGADFGSPSEPLYRGYGVLDVRQLFFLEVALRYINSGKSSEHEQCEHNYFTRNREMGWHLAPRVNTSFGQRTYKFLAPKISNFLPHSLRLVRRRSTVRKEMIRFLIEEGREWCSWALFAIQV
jgi:hypothetical protein